MLQIVILLNKPNKQYCVWIATYLCEKVICSGLMDQLQVLCVYVKCCLDQC